MGIQGLWPLLKDHTRVKNIRDYAGKCVAVDTYVWLHKAAFGCCVELATGKDTQQWLRYCFDYIELLLQSGISIYLVFDGGPLPAKKSEELERRKKRELALKKGLELLQAGHSARARAKLSRAVDISPLMAARLIKACKEKYPDVRCLVAPYEADAQLAYMYQAGIVDAVITEDSDAVPYGCGNIITKLEKSGYCQCVSLADVYQEPSSVDFRKFSRDMMVLMCVAAGCDYLTSLPGVGVKKSYKYVSRHRTVHRLLRALRFEGLIPLNEVHSSMVPPAGGSTKLYQYELDYYKAVLTFRHQTVYDPVKRQLRHLSDLPVESSTVDSSDGTDIYKLFLGDKGSLSFLGPTIPANFASDIAEGLRDPGTLEPYNFDACPPSPHNVVDYFCSLSTYQQPIKTQLVEADPTGSEKKFMEINDVNKNSGLPSATISDFALSSEKVGKKRGLLQFMHKRTFANSSGCPAGTVCIRNVSNGFSDREAAISSSITQRYTTSPANQFPHLKDFEATFRRVDSNEGDNHDTAWSYERDKIGGAQAGLLSTLPVLPDERCSIRDPGCSVDQSSLSPTQNATSKADFSHFALEMTPESFKYNVSPQRSPDCPRDYDVPSLRVPFSSSPAKDFAQDDLFQRYALESPNCIVGLQSQSPLKRHRIKSGHSRKRDRHSAGGAALRG